LYQLTMVRNTM